MSQVDPQQVAQRLVESDETQLLEILGLRHEVIERDPALASDPDPSLPRNVTSMGLRDSLKTIGERVFARWNREAHRLVCGKDADEAQSRDDLRRAMGLGDAAAAAALTSLVLVIPGMPVALAPVVAALIVKRFAAPALDELCEYWGEQLDAESRN